MPQSSEIGSIPDIVRFWATQSPDNVGLICDTETVSYASLNQRSEPNCKPPARRGAAAAQSRGLPGHE
jgi:hypothetical protein